MQLLSLFSGLLVVLLALVPGDRGQEPACDGNGRFNGCVIPGEDPSTVNRPLMNEFRKACNRQYTCYSCGSGQGIGRTKCDNAFHQNMLASCTNFFCTLAAGVYHNLVSESGQAFYKTSPAPFCSEAWVSGCLPPQ